MLPGGSLVQGHLRELATDNLALFQRCAERNGIVQFRVYWYRCHVVTDPELAGAMLVAKSSAFMKTRALQVARPTFGNGLVTAEGEAWRRQQRLLRPFVTPRAASGYDALIARAMDRKRASWRTASIVDLHDEMVDVSLEVVCNGLFGVDAGEVQPLIRRAAAAVQQWHSDCQALCLPYPHYLPTPANIRYRSETRALDRAVYALIRRVRSGGGKGHALLGAMLDVRDEDGTPIRDEEIRDQVVTLFLAGHDTTASSLAFALYELSYRPDLQARIALETRDGEQKSECLEHVIKETLRLYPAVHLVARTALCDVELGRYLVRRGDEVVLPLYVMQRSPKLFRRPDEFEPERWAEGGGKAVCPRYAHLPFSTGERVCVGQAIAMTELRSIIATLLKDFRVEPLGPRAPRLDNRMTLTPARGSTRVRLVPASSSDSRTN
ncbi:MAG TPA: cytochrome P450 [Labilithrix sp.]|jgi:cytochrome P450|nr:cytochrome P450 [Labilithrix sp.]